MGARYFAVSFATVAIASVKAVTAVFGQSSADSPFPKGLTGELRDDNERFFVELRQAHPICEAFGDHAINLVERNRAPRLVSV